MVSVGFLSCRPLVVVVVVVVVVEGGGIQFRVSNKELWWARKEEQLWKDCRKMCVHILPCTYACVCACRLGGCAAPSHGEAYLCTLRFLYLSISPLEAMSTKKKNNNNKNWNPVLLLWRRQLRFHHYLKFCCAKFWFTKVCTLFFWCRVISMYVLPARNYLFGSGSNLFECNGSSCFQAPVFCIPPWIIFGSSDGFAAIYWSLLHSMMATWWTTTTTPNFSTSCGASPCPIHKSRDGYLSVLQTPLGFPQWQAQSPLSVNCSQITKLSYFFAVGVGSHSEVNLSKSVRDKKDPLDFLMGCCCSFFFTFGIER